MFKVLLIDDDVPMLEYLEHLIDWNELDLKLVGATHSSELALDLFRELEPDVVVTDIGLPVMNGIQLAREFRVMKPDTGIIFLTCYEDTHYLKQAFQLEADDYLIKDELSREKLVAGLGKSLRWLKSKEESLKQMAFKQDVQRNKDLLKKNFLEAVLSGKTDKETLLFGERLQIRWPHPLFRLDYLHLDAVTLLERYSLKDYELIQYAVYNMAQELVTDDDHITPFLYQDKGIYIVHNHESKHALEQSIAIIRERIRSHVHQYLKVDLVALSNAEPIRLSELAGAFRSIQDRRRDGFYDIDSIIPGKGVTGSQGKKDSYSFEKDLSVIKKAFDESNPAFIDAAVSNIRLSAAQHDMEPDVMIEICGHLVHIMAGECRQPASEAVLQTIKRSMLATEVEQLTKHELKRLFRQVESSRLEVPEDPEMHIINTYIDEHLCEPVTSIDIANHLHLNSSYFSRFFKKRTGMNFTEYVHQYKMKIAVGLLQHAEETIENAAYNLGYSDRAYFSKVFKKYVGVSPGEYKREYAKAE